MKQKQVKTTTDLTWTALKEEYVIGTVKIGGKLVQVDELQDAIASGELLGKVQACADELHSGDITRAIEALKRNLSSVKTRSKNYKDLQRAAVLWDFANSVVAKTSVVSGDKPKWQATVEDIEALRGNYEELRKLYNLMRDYIASYPERVETICSLDVYEGRIQLVLRLRNEAKKASEVPTDLLAKLQGNKKLTAEEAAAVLKLLQR